VRRTQAILVIVALLATPLALLARGIAGDMSECDRYCCLSHRHHTSHPQPAKTTAEERGMSCHHEANSKTCLCLMRSGQTQMDFGFLAPLPPTHASDLVRIAGPASSRVQFTERAGTSLSGFLTAPFEPPRS